MEETIKALTELGSEAVQAAIEGYARWYLTSAICWFVVGIALVIAGIWATRHKFNKDDCESWDDVLRFVVGGLVIAIGVSMIIYNLSTIISPAGYGTHHFLQDVIP